MLQPGKILSRVTRKFECHCDVIIVPTCLEIIKFYPKRFQHFIVMSKQWRSQRGGLGGSNPPIRIEAETTCTSERSFSTLRRLKTYLRNTTNEERLNGLAVFVCCDNRQTRSIARRLCDSWASCSTSTHRFQPVKFWLLSIQQENENAVY